MWAFFRRLFSFVWTSSDHRDCACGARNDADAACKEHATSNTDDMKALIRGAREYFDSVKQKRKLRAKTSE